MRVDDLIIDTMQMSDLPALHGLSASMGWPHRAEDWALNLRSGHGLVARDAIGRLHGSAMYFPMAQDRTSLGMVIAHPRLERSGLLELLTREAMERAGSYATFLNACSEVQVACQGIGALGHSLVYQTQGYVASVPMAAVSVKTRAARPEDMADILTCDTRAYSADRHHVLEPLFAASAAVRVLTRRGEIQGYACARRFGRGQVIGPVIARSEDDAISLIAPLLDRFVGEFVRFDTRLEDGPLRRFLLACGLHPVGTVVTMTFGDVPRGGPERVYGLSSHSHG